MSFDLAIVLSACLVNLVLGFFVFVRNPSLLSSKAFFLISIFISAWSVANYLTNLPFTAIELNNLFNKLAYVFASLAVASGVWFSYSFPTNRKLSVPQRPLLMMSILLMVVLSVLPEVTGEALRNGANLEFRVGGAVWAYVIGLLILLLLVVMNLFSSMKQGDVIQKQQARFLLFGFSVTVILGLISNVVIPVVASSWQSTRFGPLLTIFLVGSITYAMVRHKLFDIRSFVLRAAVYAIVTVVLSALYIAPALYIVGTLILGFPFRIGPFVLGVFVASIAAIFYERVRRWFGRITSRIFFRDAYNPEEFISELNRAVVSKLDITDLLTEAAKVITQNIKIDYCSFVINEADARAGRVIGVPHNKTYPNKDIHTIRAIMPKLPARLVITDALMDSSANLRDALKDNDVAVMAHLTTDADAKVEGLGYILLGQKKSGLYNSQDIRTIETVIDGLIVAIQNALRFEEIQTFNVTLQQKVDDATRKLRQSNQKLQELDSAKDDFISMASHQLRTPLTSVKGYISMVLEEDAGKVTPMQRQLLDQAFVSSQRMVYLIADLLNVSRLKTGKFLIDAHPINLADVVEGEISQLVETAKSRNLELTYKKPAEFPQMMLDETKIRQVIMNFADNAIYYTPSGGHIQISVVDKPESVEFMVTDDGIGVPKSEQHHLFAKFYRAGNARKARPDGTGLGLFMAKKVIIAQGGTLIFKSQEGKGSTFGFSFPKSKLLVKPSEAPKVANKLN